MPLRGYSNPVQYDTTKLSCVSVLHLPETVTVNSCEVSVSIITLKYRARFRQFNKNYV